MINVFMIDDHPAVIAGMDFLFSAPENRVQLVGSAMSVTEAMTKLPLLEVHVILFDLFIRDESPVVNLNLLRTSWPRMPVVVYSAENSAWWKRRMFESGVNAYLNKWTSNEAVIATILMVADGSVLFAADVRNLLVSGADDPAALSLTREELEVGKEISFGLSIKEIAQKLGRSSSSIEKILRSTRIKTGAHSNADLTRLLIARDLVPAKK